ncbi:MAG TPA: GntR family transcriptional regulator [Xanthobacteraceae bacterium]|nr:GntR family transcriptional regulator [Xanthobacteraceae bacterium]
MGGELKRADNMLPDEAGPPGSLKEQAYEAIKHRIITCAFKPGEELSENAVAAMLNFGRTPVHQAFDRLHTEGLVNVQPRKGIVVRPIDLGEVIDIIETRILNEAYAARLAAERASSAEIVAIRDALARSEKVTQEGNVEGMMLLDREFHRLIARAANNFALSDILLRLHERSLRLWFMSLADTQHQASVQDQHREICEAISHRDPDAADAAMREHINSFRRNVLKNF